MTTYTRLLNSVKEFPSHGTNENGENVLVEHGENENGRFISTQTFQENNWIRVNVYYKNGDCEEFYNH